MIAIPGNVRVWLATGHTDMRRGFPSLARLVQESLKRDPHAGDLYVFRGRRGDLIKIIWHDGQGASSPDPSQAKIFKRSARFERKTKIVPENGSCRSCSRTSAARPSAPLRKSTGFVATMTFTPAEAAIM
jgi:hypothetical protein